MSDNTKVDWTQPIEALYEGQWVPATVAQRDENPETKYPYRVAFGPFTDQWYTEEGIHCIGTEALRNIPQSRQRTTDEQLTHYAERCKALVERMAGNSSMDEPYEENRVIKFDSRHYDEARAIVASMVEVDGDLVEAREVVFQANQHDGSTMKGGWDDCQEMKIALAAIRRGRALERGE